MVQSVFHDPLQYSVDVLDGMAGKYVCQSILQLRAFALFMLSHAVSPSRSSAAAALSPAGILESRSIALVTRELPCTSVLSSSILSLVALTHAGATARRSDIYLISEIVFLRIQLSV